MGCSFLFFRGKTKSTPSQTNWSWVGFASWSGVWLFWLMYSRYCSGKVGQQLQGLCTINIPRSCRNPRVQNLVSKCTHSTTRKLLGFCSSFCSNLWSKNFKFLFKVMFVTLLEFHVELVDTKKEIVFIFTFLENLTSFLSEDIPLMGKTQ